MEATSLSSHRMTMPFPLSDPTFIMAASTTLGALTIAILDAWLITTRQAYRVGEMTLKGAMVLAAINFLFFLSSRVVIPTGGIYR